MVDHKVTVELVTGDYSNHTVGGHWLKMWLVEASEWTYLSSEMI